jgi:hypothetical protein
LFLPFSLHSAHSERDLQRIHPSATLQVGPPTGWTEPQDLDIRSRRCHDMFPQAGALAKLNYPSHVSPWPRYCKAGLFSPAAGGKGGELLGSADSRGPGAGMRQPPKGSQGSAVWGGCPETRDSQTWDGSAGRGQAWVGVRVNPRSAMFAFASQSDSIQVAAVAAFRIHSGQTGVLAAARTADRMNDGCFHLTAAGGGLLTCPAAC